MATEQGYTTAEMISEIRTIMAEQQEGLLQNDEILRTLNAAQLEFCRKSKVLSTSATTTSVSSQAVYTLPNDFLVMRKVFYDTDKELEFVTDHQLLDRVGFSNLSDEGEPTYYYFRGSAEKNLCLHLWKVPSTSALTITLWYVQKPDHLTNASDERPLVDGQWQWGIIWYALYLLYMKRGQLAMARDVMALFMDVVREADHWRQGQHIDQPKRIKDDDVWEFQGVGDEATIGEV